MTSSFRETGTVDVVDDDESIRTAVSRLLLAAGYDLRTYGSAGEFTLVRIQDLNGCVLPDVRRPGNHHEREQRRGTAFFIRAFQGRDLLVTLKVGRGCNKAIGNCEHEKRSNHSFPG